MTHPAGYIVFGIVLVAAAVIGFLAAKPNRPPPHGYGNRGSGGGTRYPSPPPSPPRSPVRRRRRSPETRRRSPERRPAKEQPDRPQRSTESHSVASQTTATIARTTCCKCDRPPFIKINPCNHASMCKGCFLTHLEKNDTCPDCRGRIDSCSPPIPPLGKCKKCRKFKELFKFLPCNHSLSLCVSCFEAEDKCYTVCPECNLGIRESDPKYPSLDICRLCQRFCRLALYQPCGHRSFCRREALLFLENSGNECSECCEKVTKVV